MKVLPDHIPHELSLLQSFVLWKEFDRHGKRIKSPVTAAGFRVGYNTSEALMSFESTKESLSRTRDLGIGISLLDGLKVKVGANEGYLWCLDFDGFAESTFEEVDDGVLDFLKTFPSYVEYSPSGTGFKCFFVCDRKPSKKSKIKFGPSGFASEYPNVKKYINREVEIFSCKLFLALTGHLFSDSTKTITFRSSSDFDRMLEHLDKWAIGTGGSGAEGVIEPINHQKLIKSNTAYSKLTKSSLETVLAYIDNVDEGGWTDIANVLARVYGEIGRSYFLSFSKGEYSNNFYSTYGHQDSNERFDRALEDLKSRPDGYGIAHLLKAAKSHPSWSHPSLEYEEENPFKNLGSHDLQLNSKASSIVIEGLSDPLAEKVDHSCMDQLRKFSVTGQSKELKQAMLNDVFIMDRIAILGQWTAIYAAPNTGKTLLTFWMLREQVKNGLIDAENVFYINADDHFRGMAEKVEIAESFDMGMFVPNLNEFTVDKTLPIMSNLAATGKARGTIFVLDTLKKFTDLMDKRVSSNFGRVAREFVTAGGSLIVLAHTNKHKNAEGKSIYSGTSDIVDDADCVFIIDKVGECEDLTGKKITVEFSKIKARGDVASTLGFTYNKGCQSYLELLDSVKRIDEKGLEGTKLDIERKKKLEIDEDIIIAASQAIKAGINTKDALIKEIKKGTGDSTARVRKVIETRAGDDYAQGHRWEVKAGEHNSKIFSVLPTPYILNN